MNNPFVYLSNSEMEYSVKRCLPENMFIEYASVLELRHITLMHKSSYFILISDERRLI